MRIASLGIAILVAATLGGCTSLSNPGAMSRLKMLIEINRTPNPKTPVYYDPRVYIDGQCREEQTRKAFEAVRDQQQTHLAVAEATGL